MGKGRRRGGLYNDALTVLASGRMAGRFAVVQTRYYLQEWCCCLALRLRDEDRALARQLTPPAGCCRSGRRCWSARRKSWPKPRPASGRIIVRWSAVKDDIQDDGVRVGPGGKRKAHAEFAAARKDARAR